MGVNAGAAVAIGPRGYGRLDVFFVVAHEVYNLYTLDVLLRVVGGGVLLGGDGLLADPCDRCRVAHRARG